MARLHGRRAFAVSWFDGATWFQGGIVGLIVSYRGGRVLGTAVATAHAMLRVADAVGSCPAAAC